MVTASFLDMIIDISFSMNFFCPDQGQTRPQLMRSLKLPQSLDSRLYRHGVKKGCNSMFNGERTQAILDSIINLAQTQ